MEQHLCVLDHSLISTRLPLYLSSQPKGDQPRSKKGSQCVMGESRMGTVTISCHHIVVKKRDLDLYGSSLSGYIRADTFLPIEFSPLRPILQDEYLPSRWPSSCTLLRDIHVYPLKIIVATLCWPTQKCDFLIKLLLVWKLARALFFLFLFSFLYDRKN